MEAASHPWPTLGVLLLRDGLVSKQDLESVLDAQRDSRRQRVSGSRLGELLVERGLVSREQVAKLLAEQYELPFIELSEEDIDPAVARRLSEGRARELQALPLSALPGGSVLVAITDPATVLFAEDLREALGAPLRFAVVPQDAMDWAVTRVHSLAPDSGPDGADEADGAPLAGQDDETAPAGDSRYLGSPRAVAQLWPPLGALLIREGLITDEELDAALAQQRLSAGKRLGEILVERGSVTRSDVARLLAEQYELPFVDLVPDEIDGRAASLLAPESAQRWSGLPIGFEPDGTLRVAIADPAAVLYSDELRGALDLPVRFVVTSSDALEGAIARAYEGAAAVETDAETEARASPVQNVVDVEDVPLRLEQEPGSPRPDVEAPEVEEALERALALGATDVHLTPQPHAVVARVRIDGRLRELASYPKARQDAIAARLKLLAGLDVASSHAPQEGHLRLEVGDGADLRLVVLPTANGEKATLHFLGELTQPSSLAELGLPSTGEQALRAALSRDSGLVLVCGPPESGCSTTLYALLRELNTPERALATIEEAVEQVLPGLDQVCVDAASGFGYASALRAILLSDPDVLLVDELVDAGTAVGAVRAAVSGRVVLSRLRSASQGAALERLSELGVEPGSLAATLWCLVVQRLVQRICVDCREPYYASGDDLAALDRTPDEAGRRLLARGGGCVACDGTGFRGRAAVFEVLSPTDEIRGLLAGGSPAAEIERAAVAAGMETFRDQCIRLCLEGVTHISQLQRISVEPRTAEATRAPGPVPTWDADEASAPA